MTPDHSPGSPAGPATPPPPSRGIRALVVEDEVPVAALIGSYLEREGYQVHLSADGLDAVHRAYEIDPDLVVLDIGLPGLDGVEVCRRLRTFSDAYIVMVTARSEEIDKLVGLGVGADDYLTKPFSLRELVARVRAMLRRPRQMGPGAPPEELLRFGALRISPGGREVWIDDQPVQLTRTEFDVLAAIAAHPQQVFTRRQLIDAVWDQAWVGDEHLVDVHVGHLRRKLGDDAQEQRYIRTVRGVGYRMATGR